MKSSIIIRFIIISDINLGVRLPILGPVDNLLNVNGINIYNRVEHKDAFSEIPICLKNTYIMHAKIESNTGFINLCNLNNKGIPNIP